MDIEKDGDLEIWQNVMIGVVNGAERDTVAIVVAEKNLVIELPDAAAAVLGKALYAKSQKWSAEQTRKFMGDQLGDRVGIFDAPSRPH